MSRWRRQQERQRNNAACLTLFHILYFFAATARLQREITKFGLILRFLQDANK